MDPVYVLHANCDLPHLGIRSGDCPVLRHGKAYLCREIPLSGLLAAHEDGALTLVSQHDDPDAFRAVVGLYRPALGPRLRRQRRQLWPSPALLRLED